MWGAVAVDSDSFERNRCPGRSRTMKIALFRNGPQARVVQGQSGSEVARKALGVPIGETTLSVAASPPLPRSEAA